MEWILCLLRRRGVGKEVALRTSLQGFGYDDVVHQFENRYKVRQTKTFLLLIIRS